MSCCSTSPTSVDSISRTCHEGGLVAEQPRHEVSAFLGRSDSVDWRRLDAHIHALQSIPLVHQGCLDAATVCFRLASDHCSASTWYIRCHGVDSDGSPAHLLCSASNQTYHSMFTGSICSMLRETHGPLHLYLDQSPQRIRITSHSTHRADTNDASWSCWHMLKLRPQAIHHSYGSHRLNFERFQCQQVPSNIPVRLTPMMRSH